MICSKEFPEVHGQSLEDKEARAWFHYNAWVVPVVSLPVAELTPVTDSATEVAQARIWP